MEHEKAVEEQRTSSTRPFRVKNVDADEVGAKEQLAKLRQATRTTRAVAKVAVADADAPAKAPTQRKTSSTTKAKGNDSEPQSTISRPLPTVDVSNSSSGSSAANPLRSLIDPDEISYQLPETRPTAVLRQLEKLHQNISAMLTGTYEAPKGLRDQGSPVFVVKWVDYTNKFGLGYILSDGSVGCLFQKNSGLPLTCLVVRDAEVHMQNRDNEAYPARQQLIPISGRDVEFYESHDEDGFKLVCVPAKQYEVSIGPDGTAEKMSRGTSEYDCRKKEKILTWRKFANYMTINARDRPLEDEYEHKQQTRAKRNLKRSVEPVVVFYQRFGDVGCWVFADGHFQVRNSVVELKKKKKESQCSYSLCSLISQIIPR
jgi:hypothetical protein